MLCQSKLNFTYGVLPVEDSLDKSYNKFLRTKIEGELLKFGPAESSPNYSIIAKPELIIHSSDISTTAPIYYTSNMELSIIISDYSGSITFGSFNLPLKGAGRSLEKSISNSIENINLNTSSFHKFITQTDSRIKEYLSAKSTSILSNAKNYIENENSNNISPLLINDNNKIIISHLGMLVHYNIETEKALSSIHAINLIYMVGKCADAKKQASILLETNRFEALGKLYSKFHYCKDLIEGGKVQERLDKHTEAKAKSLLELSKIKSERLEKEREYNLQVKRNEPKGFDILFKAVANIFRM